MGCLYHSLQEYAKRKDQQIYKSHGALSTVDSGEKDVQSCVGHVEEGRQ